MDSSLQRVIKALKLFFKDRFDLHEDKERESVTKADIAKGSEFKGTNLWILIFAIIIASIGLNVNSPAIIIGAMLISPLMGPIMGIGLGVGVYDIPLIKLGARNLMIAVVISILTSTLYFLITPLAEAQSELLSRTHPSIWDVMIAFTGGLAGIIAGSRKEKSNAIPGVAIATALMPPLCTAGYGLAIGNWEFFGGALFLFFINCVFISVSTVLIVRLLKYRKKKFENPKLGRKVHGWVTFFVIITVVPSAYFAYNLVRKSVFEQNARSFIENEFNFPLTQVISSELSFGKEGGEIEVTLFGKLISQEALDEAESDLATYNLSNSKLNIIQAYKDNTEDLMNIERISQNMKSGLIEDLYKRNEQVIESKDERIKLLEDALYQLQSSQYPVMDISEELRIQYEGLRDFTIMDGYIRNVQKDEMDTICFARVSFLEPQPDSEYEKIRKWLQVRLKVDSISIIPVIVEPVLE